MGEIDIFCQGSSKELLILPEYLSGLRMRLMQLFDGRAPLTGKGARRSLKDWCLYGRTGLNCTVLRLQELFVFEQLMLGLRRSCRRRRRRSSSSTASILCCCCGIDGLCPCGGLLHTCLRREHGGRSRASAALPAQHLCTVLRGGADGSSRLKGNVLWVHVDFDF